MLIGDQKEAEKILATQTQTTQQQTSQNQQTNVGEKQSTEQQIIQNIQKQSTRTLIRQKFEKMFRKIFSKTAAIGFIRELARQLLTGLFTAIFTIIGMKMSELMAEALTNKETPLIIGLDNKNQELGRIEIGTNKQNTTTIILRQKEKAIMWKVPAEKAGDVMEEAIEKLNATRQLSDMTLTQNSPLTLMPHIQTKTIIWLIIAFLVGLIFKVIITKKILGTGKKLAVVVASSLGVGAYAKDHGAGLLDDMVMGITMMAWVWVWDEFDDFQDGIDALKGGGEGGGEAISFKEEIKQMLIDPELTIGAMLLGFFGQILGVSDPMQLVIPGMLGFAQYVSETFPPAPWGHILRIIYDILAFVLANVVASGAKGIGWVFYLAGSILGNILMQNIINALET